MDDAISAAFHEARQYRSLGRLREAHRAYGQAASLARASNRANDLADALRHVSDIARETGELPEALTAGGEAVALYRAEVQQAPLGLANALRVTALALTELGRKDEARSLWLEARAIYAELNVEAGVAECEANL